MELYWFHAFNRNEPEDIIQVLRYGPRPHPDPNAPTPVRERQLGIAPTRVYAYLGRTIQAFGQRALAIRVDGLVGEISPFDSGGLVEHIGPVNTWEPPERVRYLAAHSWSSSELSKLLTAYPGNSLASYLDGVRPGFTGPHECLPCGHLSGNIWKETGNTWQAWTWEGRSSTSLQVDQHLIAWTCSPDEYATLMTTLANTLTDADTLADAMVELASKYRNGGVAALVDGLRDAQERTLA